MIDIEIKTDMCRTSLHISVLQNFPDLVKLLLDNRADPNTQDTDYCTPLHYASNFGHY